MSETQEAQQLRRRARRRLVGAIALVLFLVIVPPMVMDLEPKPVTTDLTVEIPRQESARLAAPPPAPAPRAAAPEKAAATEPEPRKPAAEEKKTDAKKAEPKAAPEEKKAPEAKVAAAERKAQETARAEAILKGESPPAGESYVVPLGAYANPDNVKQLQAKLAKAGVKSFTEAVKSGSAAQTRVAAGPYASRAEAESAREKLAALKDLGVVPGTVTTR